MSDDQTKKRIGRPEATLDPGTVPEQFRKLGQQGASIRDIARHFGVADTTIRRHMNNYPEYEIEWQKGRQDLAFAIIGKQMEQGLKRGCAKMLTLLGKHYAGQNDVQRIEVSDNRSVMTVPVVGSFDEWSAIVDGKPTEEPEETN